MKSDVRPRSIHPDGLIDEVSDLEQLAAHGYDSDAFVEDVTDVQEALETARKLSNIGSISGMSHGGSLFWAARMPPGLVYWIEKVDPDLLRNKPRFYRYLDRHPQYKMGKLKRMTSIGSSTGTR